MNVAPWNEDREIREIREKKDLKTESPGETP